MDGAFTLGGSTPISELIAHSAFAGFGRLLFPLGDYAPARDATLADVPEYLPWYSEVRLDTTLEVLGDLLERADAGKRVFFDIYTDEEKVADPSLADTGLFFWPARGGAAPTPFAISCAGGGNVYVGAIHDSFPVSLEISQAGYTAFSLIYRSERDLARLDLARAIAWVREHAGELGVAAEGYSLWGGSAGARLVQAVGSAGPEAFGAPAGTPWPSALVMQYTSCPDFGPSDPPTFACMGEADTVSRIEGLQARMDGLASLGIDCVFERYPGLDHGFGIGRGTVAEGWCSRAIAFWERQL